MRLVASAGLWTGASRILQHTAPRIRVSNSCYCHRELQIWYGSYFCILLALNPLHVLASPPPTHLHPPIHLRPLLLVLTHIKCWWCVTGLYHDVSESIRFFVAFYDPIFNIGLDPTNSTAMAAVQGMQQCVDGSICSDFENQYKYHPSWAPDFYERFRPDIPEASMRRFKLYSHIYANTASLILSMIQFHGPTRKSWPSAHRTLGYLTALSNCIGLAAALSLGFEHGGIDSYGGSKLGTCAMRTNH